MKYMFLLSGENIELAKEEVLAIVNKENYKIYENLLILNCKKFDFDRLAFTHKVLKLIFKCNIKDFEKKLKLTNWNKTYNNDFCVRTKGINMEVKKIASFIWKKIKNPKVKLKKSSSQYEFIKINDKVFCGILEKKIKKGYMNRRPHLRKGFHPSSINPKLARACINLSGIKKNEILYDPFCGTGGILIEAALIGCKIIGSDIDEIMLKKTKINLEDLNINKYKLYQADATKVQEKCDAIVTDPPYGKASSLFKKEKLYENFLKNVSKILKKDSRLVFILPSNKKFNTNLKLIKTIDFYVHFSLTRRIYIFKIN